jgi:hypothetical protein
MKMSKKEKVGNFFYFLLFLFVALATTIGLNANYAWAQEGEGEDESAGEDKKVEEDLDIDLDMKKMGIGLEYKRETLEKVKSPPDKIDNLSVGAMLNIMSGDNMSSMMYGGLFGWQRLNPSGNFQGIEGGKRHCFSNEVFALLLLGQMKSETETVDTSSGSVETTKEEKTTSMTMMGGAYSPSWVYLKFGPMDEATLKQKGWLFKLGIMLGFMHVSVGDEDVGDMDSTMPLIGPNVGFGFPKYNAGTAKMTVFNIFGYILPIGDTTTASINMSYQW